MDVLFIVQNYPPERGAVSYTYNLAASMACAGHDVRVVTGLPHYPTGKPYKGFGRYKTIRRTEEGITVIRTPLIMGSNSQIMRRILGFITFIPSALRWTIRSKKPNVIVGSIPPVTISIICLITAYLRGVPFVLIMRDIEPIYSMQLRNLNDKLLNNVLICFFFWIYRKARKIILIHEKQRLEFMKRRFDCSKLAVIPHSIDLERFEKMARAEINIKLERKAGRIIALYAGTIGLCHDIDTLLNLLAKPEIQKLPIDFYFFGSGEKLTQSIQTVSDYRAKNIFFESPVSLKDIPSLLSQADLLIVSNKDNPNSLLGSKIIEYCASGKPILVHGPTIVRKFINNIGNGLTCENGNFKELFGILKEFIINRNYWKDKGKSGCKFIHDNYNLKNNANKFENELKNVLDAFEFD